MLKISIIIIILTSLVYTQDFTNRNYLSSNQIKDKIYDNLEKLELIYLKKLNPRDYNASKELIFESILLLFSIPDFEFDNYYYVMSEFDFKIFLSDLKNEFFTEDKLTLIETVALNNYFTIAQVYQILEYIDFDSDRIDAFRILLPSIVDKYNSYRILNLFTNSTDKQTIRNLISNYIHRRR
jgi:hypothetical protein